MSAEVRNMNTIVDQKLCLMGNDLTLELRLGYKSKSCNRANLLKFKRAATKLNQLRPNPYETQNIQTIKNFINAL